MDALADAPPNTFHFTRPQICRPSDTCGTSTLGDQPTRIIERKVKLPKPHVNSSSVYRSIIGNPSMPVEKFAVFISFPRGFHVASY
jgi:hypothetical protein